MHRSGWKLLRTVGKVCGIVAIAIAASLIVIVPIARWFLFGGDRFTGTTFTPEAWAEAGNCVERADLKKCEEEWGRCPRGPMVWSLTHNHLIVGKLQRDEAVRLLGPGFRDRERYGKSCMVYTLGACSGFGIDYDDLELCFDDSGLLTSSRHHQS